MHGDHFKAVLVTLLLLPLLFVAAYFVPIQRALQAFLTPPENTSLLPEDIPLR